MDNHVHLLICIDQIPISKIMQGIQQAIPNTTIKSIDMLDMYSNNTNDDIAEEVKQYRDLILDPLCSVISRTVSG